MFSTALRMLIKADKRPRSALAQALGVSESYIRALESGRRDNPSLKMLQKIAVFFGVQLMDLLWVESEGEEQVRSIALDCTGLSQVGRAKVQAHIAALAAKRGKTEHRHTSITFSTALHMLVKADKRSRSALAQALGVSESYIRALEFGQKDNPSLKMLRKIAALFEVHPADLLWADDGSVSMQTIAFGFFSLSWVGRLSAQKYVTSQVWVELGL